MSVLVSSAARRVALVEIFRRVLEEVGLPPRVVAADAAPLSAACAVADRAALVPPCTDPDFVPSLIEICREEEIRLLIRTIDPELSALAAARADFAAVGTTVAVSAPEVVRTTSDKRLAHGLLVRHGLPTVEQDEVATVRSAGWDFPLVVKPVAGSASEGVQVVTTPTAFEAAVESGDVVVQRQARGEEYTVDCLVDNVGRMLGGVPRRRLTVRGGEVSKGRTVDVPALTQAAGDVCAALPGAFGVLNVQMFLDPDDGSISIIEVNPRFGGGYPLSHAAGAPFVRWLIQHAWGLRAELDMSWRDGVVMLGFDDAVFLDPDGKPLP